LKNAIVVNRALAIDLPQERNFTRYATVMAAFFAISCEFFHFSRVAGGAPWSVREAARLTVPTQCQWTVHRVFYLHTNALNPYLRCLSKIRVESGRHLREK